MLLTVEGCFEAGRFIADTPVHIFIIAGENHE
jgi:hypothetical protein